MKRSQSEKSNANKSQSQKHKTKKLKSHQTKKAKSLSVFREQKTEKTNHQVRHDRQYKAIRKKKVRNYPQYEKRLKKENFITN